jgi:predicted phage terminase large subunit-like protein
MPEPYKPHPGPQTEFHKSAAFELLFGGSAGPGKSLSLLMEATRHIDNPAHKAILFRKTFPQLEGSGGLIEKSQEYFTGKARYKGQPSYRWTFPSAASIKFAHMQNTTDHMNYQGHEYTYMGFDEISAFPLYQYLYLFSRVRTLTTSGIFCKVRCAGNPPEDFEPGMQWIQKRWGPWLDPKHPYPAGPGELRWYAIDKHSNLEIEIDKHDKSFTKDEKWSRTFIPGRYTDNPSLDSSYARNLDLLPYVQRQRLKFGDWNVRPAAGKVFNKNWFHIVPRFPEGQKVKFVRFWDTAATEKKIKAARTNDPDYVASCKACLYEGKFYMQFMRDRKSPAEVTNWIKRTAENEENVEIGVEQEPGSQSKLYLDGMIRDIGAMNRTIRAYKTSKSKVDRASPVSAQAEAGNVYIVENPALKTDEILDEYHGFPDWAHDDMVDAGSGAWNMVAGRNFEFVKIGPDGTGSNSELMRQIKAREMLSKMGFK